MNKQLAHLCLKTSQLERMAVFYRDSLGATVKFRYLNPVGQPIGVLLRIRREYLRGGL